MNAILIKSTEHDQRMANLIKAMVVGPVGLAAAKEMRFFDEMGHPDLHGKDHTHWLQIKTRL